MFTDYFFFKSLSLTNCPKKKLVREKWTKCPTVLTASKLTVEFIIKKKRWILHAYFESSKPISFYVYFFSVNELILKQKQRSEEKRFKLDHSVSSTVCSNFLTLFNGFIQQLLLCGLISNKLYC